MVHAVDALIRQFSAAPMAKCIYAGIELSFTQPLCIFMPATVTVHVHDCRR